MKPICKFYLKSECRDPRCRFRHPVEYPTYIFSTPGIEIHPDELRAAIMEDDSMRVEADKIWVENFCTFCSIEGDEPYTDIVANPEYFCPPFDTTRVMNEITSKKLVGGWERKKVDYDRNDLDRGNYPRDNNGGRNFDRNNYPRNNNSGRNFDRNNYPRNNNSGNFDRGNYSRDNNSGNFDRGNYPRDNNSGNFDRGNYSRDNNSRNFDRGNYSRDNNGGRNFGWNGRNNQSRGNYENDRSNSDRVQNEKGSYSGRHSGWNDSTKFNNNNENYGRARDNRPGWDNRSTSGDENPQHNNRGNERWGSKNALNNDERREEFPGFEKKRSALEGSRQASNNSPDYDYHNVPYEYR